MRSSAAARSEGRASEAAEPEHQTLHKLVPQAAQASPGGTACRQWRGTSSRGDRSWNAGMLIA